MDWSEKVASYINALAPATPDVVLARRILPLIDLTSLQDTDTTSSIGFFCEKARNDFGHVAAVCVYPDFIRMVADNFAGTDIRAATVINFPQGDLPLEQVIADINAALTDGAEEIDVVFPYQRYLAGEQQYIRTFVESCKAACGDATLKVILETGILVDLAFIADATYDVLAAGADFVKTSTGKVSVGATLEAAATMLLVIQHIQPKLRHHVGLKISGGVRTLEQAASYLALAEAIMGRDWVSPKTFRIGASQLVDAIAALG